MPVPYFHVVYTLPSKLRDIAYQNKRVVYDLLMKATAEKDARHRRRSQAPRRVLLRQRRPLGPDPRLDQRKGRLDPGGELPDGQGQS